VWVSEQTVRILYTATIIDHFYNRDGVFTVRYGPCPKNVTQINRSLSLGSLCTFTLQKNRFVVSLTIKYYNFYDSAVGIVTRHGLEGAGFKFRHVQDIFSSPKTRPAMVTT
jgi:hypothetical protein